MMRHDDLDHILSKDMEILPSSGFAAAVMHAVRSEATAPPPIPFPWKRALPGLAAAGFVLASFLVSFAQFAREAASPQPPALPPSAALILDAAKTVGAGWVFLALLLTLVSVMLSMRLIRVR